MSRSHLIFMSFSSLDSCGCFETESEDAIEAPIAIQSQAPIISPIPQPFSAAFEAMFNCSILA